MRFVPLVPSDFEPASWRSFPALELAWRGALREGWAGAPIHAIHLEAAPWDPALGERAMAVLRTRLAPDFLVLPAAVPEGRLEHSAFMSVLEGLLEITHGTGVKLALRPAPGAAPGLARILKEARGEAVGFCWDATVGDGLESISDRLFCAVLDSPLGSAPGLAALQDLGYRWNVALPARDPASARSALKALEKAHPDTLFPCALQAPPDPDVKLGPPLEERP